ncbi:MAG: flagellar brake protein [Acetatifactor sp.]|nr:flagellar brake protein [Acetatifactor sp.]
MIGKFVEPGNKVELQSVDRAFGLVKEEEQKSYHSTVYDILSEDTMELTMPLEQSKLILLPVDSEYNLVFYGPNGPYQCFARIIDRYKTENVYVFVVELTSNLRKYQRREYYRFSCALEMCSRTLVEEEIQAIEKRIPYELHPGLPLKRSVIVDISGGGLRFICSQKYEVGTLIYCSYHLIKDGERKHYEVIGKVLGVKELESRPGTYEHRVQYYNIDESVREEIIKFIFEEERRERKMTHK